MRESYIIGIRQLLYTLRLGFLTDFARYRRSMGDGPRLRCRDIAIDPFQNLRLACAPQVRINKAF